MSIENIISKIESDAKVEADKIIAESKEEIHKILEEAKGRAAILVADAESKGAADTEKQVISKKSVAVIDGKNKTLAEKQRLIDDCFTEAVGKVEALEGDEYLSFLTNSVKAYGKDTGEIILGTKDKEIGDKLIEKLSKEIPGGTFTLSQETRDIKGGLMIKDGSRYFNASIDAIVGEVREGMTAEVADILFETRER